MEMIITHEGTSVRVRGLPDGRIVVEHDGADEQGWPVGQALYLDPEAARRLVEAIVAAGTASNDNPL